MSKQNLLKLCQIVRPDFRPELIDQAYETTREFHGLPYELTSFEPKDGLYTFTIIWQYDTADDMVQDGLCDYGDMLALMVNDTWVIDGMRFTDDITEDDIKTILGVVDAIVNGRAWAY